MNAHVLLGSARRCLLLPRGRSERKVIIRLKIISALRINMQLSYSDKLDLKFFLCRYLWQMFIPVGGKCQ